TMSMINMAGGVPHPSMFPLMQVQARIRAPSGYSDDQDGVLVLDKSKHSSSAESLDELLQYNDGRGMGSYCRFLRKHTQMAHCPLYADWDVIASCGSTDAIGKVFSLFCQPGDSIIVEQWSFPGALSNLSTSGVKPVAVAMDSEGMLPEELDSVCTSWTGERPLRAMYIVPTGQNPTGATMSLARRNAIYTVAQKHNLAIIEDDPYYFLQLGPLATEQGNMYNQPQSGKQELVPSLLSLDVDGRVIRLDSFSKILAPNLRCGWITAPTYLLDRLQILNESSILQPSGLTQGVLAKMLSETWGLEGWSAHLRDLRAEYTQRRNLFVQLARKHLCGLVEFDVPTAGMFLWMKVD
ncbi:PLP-dependent transferase, partial [Coemansia reversa NRRL 1564]